MPEQDWDQFKQRLDDVHEWPCDYTFKFVMPAEIVEEFVTLIDIHPYTERQSSKGNYVSVTAVKMVFSSEDVVQIYRRAARFDKVVSL